MPRAAIGFGVVLIAVGIAFFLGTGMHFTALIPSFIGFVLLICGVVGAQEVRRKSAMHAAAGVALLGFLGCADGVFKVVNHLLGTTITRPAAQYEKLVAAILCAVFLAMCIRSFIDARRNAQAR